MLNAVRNRPRDLIIIDGYDLLDKLLDDRESKGARALYSDAIGDCTRGGCQ